MIILSPKFKSLFTSEARFYVITGGRGSQKSFAVGAFASLLSFETGHKVLFTRQTMISAHLSIIPEFQEKINLIEKAEYFEVNKAEIKNKVSGSEIIFKGIKTSSGDQTASLKSLQGVTTWILDEAEEMTEEAQFDKINLSIRQKGAQNRVIIILNPATKEHWIYRRFFEDAAVEPGFNGTKGHTTYIHTTFQDNEKNLDQSFLDEVENIRLRSPEKFKHIVLGGWLDKAEGVIYTNWRIGDFIEIGTPVFGQDIGFSIDPSTMIKTSIDRTHKRIYIQEQFCKPKMTTSDIYLENMRYAKGCLIYADSAEIRLITEVAEKGCNIKQTIKGPGSILAGIAILQDYELIVDPNSRNVIKELNNYIWHDKKSKTPIDMYNHCLDALRYAIYPQLIIKTELNFFVG